MLREIINSIDSKLPMTSLGFARLLTKEDQRFPAVYSSSGDFAMINFDFKDWSSYHRINGVTKRSQKEAKLEACQIEITEDIPMSLVVSFPNSKADCDDAFAAYNVAKDIANEITILNDVALSQELGARCITITATGYETDSFLVWAKDWMGVDYRVDSKSSLVRIDYLVRIIGNKDCFESNSCI